MWTRVNTGLNASVGVRVSSEGEHVGEEGDGSLRGQAWNLLAWVTGE
jgi:hypothetical protein